MEEQERRIDGIRRYLQGEKISSICRDLGRPRRWSYYWLKQYNPSDPSWPQNHSRAPRQVSTKTPEEVERLVCQIRQRLVSTKYAQKGALAIQWQLQKLGIRPLPQIWTINRILKRHGLVVKPTYVSRGKPYPAVLLRQPYDLHQLDLVGPRHLQGGQRFYGVHLIDAFSNAVALEAVPSKRAVDIVEALVVAWQRLGIPRRLQMDNELAFRGSNRYPRSFGLLIRLCLYLGVEAIFIPEAEPWRNGVIERFNDVYDKLFSAANTSQTWPTCEVNFLPLRPSTTPSTAMRNFPSPAAGGVHTSVPRQLLPQRVPPPLAGFRLHQEGLPWRDGRVSFVRLTDEQGHVRFFSERFQVDPTLVHEHVTGTIYTKPGLLKFTHQDRIIKTCRHAITKRDL